MLPIRPALVPPLEAEFQPAALWNREYRALVASDAGARPLAIGLRSPDGAVSAEAVKGSGRSPGSAGPH